MLDFCPKPKNNMNISIFSAQPFEIPYLQQANAGKHELRFLDAALTLNTVRLAEGSEGVAIFVNDDASAPVLEKLQDYGVRYLALRSAGYNHVDLPKATELGMKVANVPEYSPYAVAEHTVALMLTLNRKIIRAHNRIRDLNFSLNGLVGFDMHGKTVGIVGTGKIGAIVAKILYGFGCKLLGYDRQENKELTGQYGMQYRTMEELCRQSDIISLHIPLLPATKYIIDNTLLNIMKPGVMLINTSRGGLVNTRHVVHALKNKKIGYLGMDVYEEEKGLFFEDHSDGILQDDTIARLMTFKNVLITSHQGFLTKTALSNIAASTIDNIEQWSTGKPANNELTIPAERFTAKK